MLFDEPDGPALLRRLTEMPIRLMSSATAVVAFTGSQYPECNKNDQEAVDSWQTP
jgi:hypothetical protein